MHFVIYDSPLLIISATFDTCSFFVVFPFFSGYFYGGDLMTSIQEGVEGARNRVLWFLWGGCRGSLAEFMDSLFIV